MRAVAPVLFAAALAVLSTISAARAQDAGDPSVHIVTYIEGAPASAKQNIDTLKQFADASRKEAGVLRFEVLQRAGYAGHFAIIESWKDKVALEVHTAATSTKQFLDKVQPTLISPLDERLCNSITVASAAAAPAGAVYVMTHVDIIGPNPANRDAMIPVLKAFAEASRKAAGNERYDVLQQTSRTNHFQVVEVWKDQKSDDAHEISELNKAYRVKVTAMQGALYDQRWYSAL
jgi:quinol monooxygenase YgiN